VWTEALAAVPGRVSRLDAAARRRLDGSGMAGSSLGYPFGLPMARWLASRYPVMSSKEFEERICTKRGDHRVEQLE
jgi:hypothetical protein